MAVSRLHPSGRRAGPRSAADTKPRRTGSVAMRRTLRPRKLLSGQEPAIPVEVASNFVPEVVAGPNADLTSFACSDCGGHSSARNRRLVWSRQSTERARTPSSPSAYQMNSTFAFGRMHRCSRSHGLRASVFRIATPSQRRPTPTSQAPSTLRPAAVATSTRGWRAGLSEQRRTPGLFALHRGRRHASD